MYIYGETVLPALVKQRRLKGNESEASAGLPGVPTVAPFLHFLASSNSSPSPSLPHFTDLQTLL